ncbi:MAG TPA: MmgE/PrpD family protein [Steroidobacteraceae bacterium]|nr:MmgE/PrpD family protein [Steroidobacteraceae bacterium]
MSPIVALASYAATFAIDSESAIRTARHCLIDALARGFEALDDPERAALIGPLVPGALMPGGARVPGTSLELDPAQAAFCNGVMLCRPAGSEHWLALECGHAADSLGAILSIADYQARKATMEGQSPPKVRDLLSAAVKALEIQGVLALEGGHHHSQTAAIRLARVAATAVVTAQLGGKVGEIAEALSYSCIDGGTATGVDEERAMGRGEWATADAISRAVRHACQVMAAARPSAATSLHPRTLELAARLLGPGAWKAAQPFGTKVIEQIAARRSRQDVVELTSRFQSAVDRRFPARQAERIKTLFAAPERLIDLPVNEVLAALVANGSR